MSGIRAGMLETTAGWCVSCSVMSDSLWPHGLYLPGASVHGDSPGKNSGVGCHALLQGVFPTQGSNPGLPRCKWILYGLSYLGSLEAGYICLFMWSLHTISLEMLISWSSQSNQTSYIVAGFQKNGNWYSHACPPKRLTHYGAVSLPSDKTWNSTSWRCLAGLTF